MGGSEPTPGKQISGQLKVEGHGVPDPALSDLVFHFFLTVFGTCNCT